MRISQVSMGETGAANGSGILDAGCAALERKQSSWKLEGAASTFSYDTID